MIESRGVNHIGIAVRSLAAHRDFYERVLGATFEGVENVPDQKVRVAFYRLGPGSTPVRLELLEPTSEDSPVARFLEERGEGVHHIGPE
jgi:methylmalonyl-CoA/ethylmalonyl-CoA epimerase